MGSLYSICPKLYWMILNDFCLIQIKWLILIDFLSFENSNDLIWFDFLEILKSVILIWFDFFWISMSMILIWFDFLWWVNWFDLIESFWKMILPITATDI